MPWHRGIPLKYATVSLIDLNDNEWYSYGRTAMLSVPKIIESEFSLICIIFPVINCIPPIIFKHIHNFNINIVKH